MLMLKLPESQEIGKPRDWDEKIHGPCGSVFVLEVFEEATGLTKLISYYQPTTEEVEEISKGGCIALGIVGTVHPVFSLNVVSAYHTDTADFSVAWDMT